MMSTAAVLGGFWKTSPMPDYRLIAERIRVARAKRQLTQEQLAVAAKTTGRTIGKWEAAETEPSTTHIINLCAALNVSADYLLGLVEVEHGLAPGTILIDDDAAARAAAETDRSVVHVYAWRVPPRCRIASEAEADSVRARVESARGRKGR
jgi:transcriptional regulator with XRE-family HTH domain